MLSGGFNTVCLEQFHAAQGRTRYKALLIFQHKLCYICRVESINILTGINVQNDRLFIYMGRRRALHEDTVDAVIGI